MLKCWFFLTAFAVCNIFAVNGNADTADQDVEDGLLSVLGFKPCLDESCEVSGPTSLYTTGTKIFYKPQNVPPAVPGKAESPRVHCILLRPSAVEKFGGVEIMHPGISDIKYSVLEDLIDFMYRSASTKMENCEPTMKLVDLIFIAASSLRDHYLHQGAEECVWAGSETKDPTEKPYEPSETMKPVTEPPFHPSSKRPTTDKPYESSTTQQSSTKKPYHPEQPITEIPCETVPSTPKPYWTTKQPCEQKVTVTEEYTGSEEVEIIAEAPQVGSMRGIPGVHYPNYTDIPITSFTCSDKKHVPGFYADLDTGCQVFHVCYEHRRESFLCPVGTIFNQPILACDYWYSSNCSLSSSYYDVNKETELEEEKIDVQVEELLTLITEKEKSEHGEQSESDLEKITPFFPVKAVVMDIEPQILTMSTTPDVEKIASESVDKVAAELTKLVSSTRNVIQSIPDPVKLEPVQKPEFIPVFKKPVKVDLLAKTVPLAKMAAVPVSKVAAVKTALPIAGLAAKKASIPVVAAAKAKFATKIAAMPAIKLAVASPVVAKAKVVAAAMPVAKAAAATPIFVKSKFVVAAPSIVKGKAAVPAVKVVAAKAAAKTSIPVLKAKMVKSAVPLAKAKIVPLMKAKAMKGAGVPFLKAKMLALPLAKSKLAGPIPLAKAKFAKAAAISPLTKKALALGYMKLLKAKKVALLG